LEYNAISTQEVESLESSVAQAESAYNNALDMLADTRIVAPFNGVIERVYVDTYERVSSGQAIVRIVRPRSTSVGFTAPEYLLSALESPTTNYYIDSWCIPKGAANSENAHAFINYMCEVESMAANADYNTYAPPSSAAREEMDEELRNSELVFAPDDVKKNSEIYTNLPQETLDLYDSQWLRLKAAS
jgi:spermidine/putrescine transport system substrate-binding protein